VLQVVALLGTETSATPTDVQLCIYALSATSNSFRGIQTSNLDTQKFQYAQRHTNINVLQQQIRNILPEFISESSTAAEIVKISKTLTSVRSYINEI